MQTNRRWIAAAMASARTLDVQLPWERGARRAAWIVHRDGHGDLRQALSA
ncbi:hypothetical protein [Tropicimonas sediminicola]|uniref:Uncharacterized protein n=1 Tax=Tropicimonas sediminicola TaxID=1031541 RepID=A0A239LYY2_9RHOB|nr:hypothetical protein [Tropicimonas sediminicola]SNT35172.1 hypothetical protein SAMN05421757_111151 [Tropicimonas sediminicola]